MKIFGIGLPKTGTTSLASAMEILGYKSCHFPTSDTDIDEHSFICNGDICCRYRELDQKYPGTKFLVTLRDDDSWLTSIQKHFSRKLEHELLPSRRELRLKLWGTVTPSREQLLVVKHQHELDTQKYFSGRHDDVLFMRIINSDDWKELCGFISVEAPDLEFPRMNVASN